MHSRLLPAVPMGGSPLTKGSRGPTTECKDVDFRLYIRPVSRRLARKLMILGDLRSALSGKQSDATPDSLAASIPPVSRPFRAEMRGGGLDRERPLRVGSESGWPSEGGHRAHQRHSQHRPARTLGFRGLFAIVLARNSGRHLQPFMKEMATSCRPNLKDYRWR